MSKRKPMGKEEARERRNQMLASAAAANLSLTEGVREMRAIAGMTQEEFARHRGVSARVVKALELGQANPTVATMNRIGQFFGLEVGFVPAGRNVHAEGQPQPTEDGLSVKSDDVSEAIRRVIEISSEIDVRMRKLSEMTADLDVKLGGIKKQHHTIKKQQKTLEEMTDSSLVKAGASKADTSSKKKRRST